MIGEGREGGREGRGGEESKCRKKFKKTRSGRTENEKRIIVVVGGFCFVID